VKRIAATNGDVVCAVDRTIVIDGVAVATRLAADSSGRPLPFWRGCRRLRSGEFFLLMRHVPDSFDSRYFGAVKRSAIIGRLMPLWTW
jgi:conjugative transfer signal peptidase TraF